MRTGSHHDRRNRRQVEARNSSRRPARARLHIPGVELLEQRTLLSTINWINPSSGDWENPANWDLHRLPTSADDVVINMSGVTVTHSTLNDAINSLSSQDALVLSGGMLSIASTSSIDNNLTISGGTLTGAGDLTVTGLTTWTGGTMSGTGTTLASGGLTMGDAGAASQMFLDGRTLKNAGAATLSENAANGSYGLFLGSVPPSTTKRASFAFATETAIFTSGGTPAGGTFLNAGTLSKTGGTGTSVVTSGITLIDTGTIQAFSGTLSLRGGGTISGAATLTAATGATLEFGGGVFTAAAGTSITGAGVVSISGGTVTESGIYNVGGTTLVNGGEVDFNSAGSTGALTQASGTIGGSGTLTVTGLTTWTGGTMSGTGTTLASGGLAMGDAGAASQMFLDGRTLMNAGAATLSESAANGSYGLFLGSGATFDNAAGASFAFATDTAIYSNGGTPGGGTFLNGGTLSKTGGTGTSVVTNAITLIDTGTIQVQTGIVSLQGATNVATGCVLSVSAGAMLAVDASTLTLADGAAISGAGTFAVRLGTLSIPAGTASSAPATAFVFSGGTISGSGTLSVAGPLTWTGGTMSGTGTTLASGGLTMGDAGAASQMFLDGRTLMNAGAATLSENAANGSYGLFLGSPPPSTTRRGPASPSPPTRRSSPAAARPTAAPSSTREPSPRPAAPAPSSSPRPSTFAAARWTFRPGQSASWGLAALAARSH